MRDGMSHDTFFTLANQPDIVRSEREKVARGQELIVQQAGVCAFRVDHQGELIANHHRKLGDVEVAQ